jgi:ketosteroid isomerase-like protein
MKHILIVVLLMLLLPSVAVSQTKSKRTSRGGQTKPTAVKAEQSLRDMERQWTEAFKNRDKTALERILDDRFVFTDDEGQIFNKTQYIDAVMQALKVESYSLDDMTSRVFGDTGVVTGRWTGKMTVGGKDASGAFRFTDTAKEARADGDTEKQVRQLERERVEALVRADIKALDRILSDDLTYTHSTGRVDTKASLIDSIKSGTQKYEAMDHTDISVRLFRDVAVMSGTSAVKVRSGGPSAELRSFQIRFINVYVKQTGRWQMVAWQSTRLP